MQFRELNGAAALLNVPLISCDAVKGVKIRQPAKSRSSAKQLHRRGAAMATRRFGRGLVGVSAVHDTISKNPSCRNDVVLEHYRRVAGSLTFGKTTPQRRMLANHENS